MRMITLCAALAAATPALADWGDTDYAEDRVLTLATATVDELRVDAGAGSMAIHGDPDAEEIRVDALIQIEGAKGDKAREFIENSMRLSLDSRGDAALLVADFEDAVPFRGSASIALEVTLPEGLSLTVDDGSGSITIRRTLGGVRVNDGSGSIDISDVGDVTVDDGSGSIRIANVTGSVAVNDGSGGITIRQVSGDVSIDDGSGSITVRDVEGDFVVTDDGSGGVNFSNIAGAVSLVD